jgi:hypothetical protein
MSGEDTDGEAPGREKRLLRVPVKWINPELTGLFHVIDTWKSAVQDESFSTPRGNRPLTRLATSKVPVEGHVTKGLPRNWYDETWYKSQSDAKKILLNTLPSRPIPYLVSLICFVFQISSSLTIIFSNLASNSASFDFNVGFLVRWHTYFMSAQLAIPQVISFPANATSGIYTLCTYPFSNKFLEIFIHVVSNDTVEVPD